MGEALEGRRDEFVLATKFGMGDERREGAPDAPARLARVHPLGDRGLAEAAAGRADRPLPVPPPGRGDADRGDARRRWTSWSREGLVGAIGCSNFSAAELEEADRIARERGLARFVTLQNQYSLLEREIEAEVAPACERLGVSILPYFPLASGLLTGKYRRGEPGPEGSRLSSREQAGSDEQFDVVEALEAFAEARGDRHPRRRDRRPRRPARRRLGDRRRDQARADRRQRRRARSWQPSEADLAELDRIAPTPRA